MTDCSSFRSSTNSTTFNEIMLPKSVKSVSSAGAKNTRIRIVRLNRNRTSVTRNFGFSLRGGKEFGTGFFVSHVEKGSEADLRGLRAGDEIYQVNGYKVSDAVHRELSKYIASQDRITLRVRGVGIIPIKEYVADPLSWQVIGSKQPKATENLERIMLTLAPKMKLGCGICKGPEWKPGIFIQFTKENGVARNAGLRPGDQILSCNGIDFTNIAFNEAVSIMKESHTLDLLIRVSEGVDLFPNESSGYNSSASSATGDQSPCWGNENSKRLSIVREESNSSSGDKRNLNIRTKVRQAGGEVKRSLKQVQAPKVPPRSKTTQISSNGTSTTTTKGVNNTTIIKLSENGTLINNILISNYAGGDAKTKEAMLAHSMEAIKIGDNTKINNNNEQKTIKVEVHQAATLQKKVVSSNGKSIPAPPPPMMPLDLQSTASSISGVTSESDSNNNKDLKCALFEEIRRRAEKKELEPSENPKISEPPAPKKQSGTGFTSNMKQHDMLMEEFKLAHKRMFKNGFVETEKDKQQEEQHVETPPAPTPTPDYDVTPQNSLKKAPQSTLHRVVAHESAKVNGESAEMESIKSFQFNGANMGSSPPKFPQQFFVPRATGPATIKKANPQVAVKIEDYQNKSTTNEKNLNPSPAKRTLKPEQLPSALSNGAHKDTNGTKPKNKVTIVVPNKEMMTNGHA
ncbi:uncharacterized protein LOC134832563 [Culicoides brevitarsis]|uniref:uncharacterized protein LOC134832563 n=1 Tax=Culicoides brevitarsis TaxID=469753 RepID=UPI00307C1641